MKRNLISLFVLFSLSVQGLQAVSVQELIDNNELPQVTGRAARRVLNLSGLGITSLDGLQNVPNKKVHVLLLNDNKLKVIPAGPLQGFTQLEALGLRYNQVKDIEPGAFAGLTQLKVIRLGENKLTTIKRGVLEDVPQLSYLGLAANPIKETTRSNIRALVPKAKVFYQPMSTKNLMALGVSIVLIGLVIAAGVLRYGIYQGKQQFETAAKKLETLATAAEEKVKTLYAVQISYRNFLTKYVQQNRAIAPLLREEKTVEALLKLQEQDAFLQQNLDREETPEYQTVNETIRALIAPPEVTEAEAQEEAEAEARHQRSEELKERNRKTREEMRRKHNL